MRATSPSERSAAPDLDAAGAEARGDRWRRLAAPLAGLLVAAAAAAGVAAYRGAAAAAPGAPRYEVLHDGPVAVSGREIAHPYAARITGGELADWVVVQWVRGRQCGPQSCFDTGGRWVIDNQTGGADGPLPGTPAAYPSLLGPWAERDGRQILLRDAPGFVAGEALAPGNYSLHLDFLVNVYSRRALGGGEPPVERFRSPQEPAPLLSRPWTARGAWRMPVG